MEELKNLVPVVYANQRVLTNNQLADFYGTTPERLRGNFRWAKKRFIKELDYFKIEGEQLRQLKAQIETEIMAEEGVRNSNSQGGYKSPLNNATNSLILYTKQGAARHCKMLNTDKAWEVFNLLLDNYFNPAPVEVQFDTEQKTADKLKEEISMLKNQLNKIQCTEFAVVYVLLMSNGSVKIGMTKDLTERIKELKNEKKLEALDFFTTSFMPRLEATRLEQMLHKEYADKRWRGEFYNVRFVDVVATVKALVA